jgi:hypothetical protein
MPLAKNRRNHLDRQTRRSSRPRLEPLEDRLLLYSTSGAAWPFPQRITFSVVPDGTSIGGVPSNLYSTLTSRFTPAAWSTALFEAAATWEAVANINLVPVADNGAAFNSGSYQQGDSNFGDIRISGIPHGVGVGSLAYTFLPPQINGASAAGDTVYNTSTPLQMNGTNYDLLTVAIHEFGYALGMGPSAINTAVMYGNYTSINQSLTSDDISGIDAIYSARQPDAWVQTWHNTTSAAAADITAGLNSSLQASISNTSIQNNTQTEWLKLTVPATTSGTLKVTMQSTNLSELSPEVEILNSSLHGVAVAYAADAFGATVTASIAVSPGQVYYIATSGANGGPTGTGAYGLLVNLGSGSQSPIAPPNTTAANTAGTGGGGYGASVVRAGGSTSPSPTTAAGSLLSVGTAAAYGQSFSANQNVPIVGATTPVGPLLLALPPAQEEDMVNSTLTSHSNRWLKASSAAPAFYR